MVNDPATPQNDANAPTIAPNIAAWDPWIGYFQLSRFKFVDATATTPAHLDLASEQEILRVPVNRGACCHVAGDIDFDSQNNLWMVTGDDTPAGGGNSGNNAPFNGQLTNEVQLLTITGATGGTFTLTFDGQTTAPIAAPFQTGGAAATTNAAIEAALEALSNLDDVGVTGNAATNRSINFGGNMSATDVPLMTVDTTGLTGTVTGAVAQATVNNGQGLQIPAVAGNIWTEHVDARRSSLNTNDLRGKLLRVKVKDGDISLADANQSRPGVHDPVREHVPARDGADEARDLRDGLPQPVPAHPGRERRRVRDRLLARRARGAPVPGPRAPAGSRSCAGRRTTAGRSATRPTSATTSGTSRRAHRCRSERPSRTSAGTRAAGR